MQRMTRLAVLPLMALMLLMTATTAQAGEALEALRGQWLVDSFDGDAPPPGVSLTFDFVDDATMRVTYREEEGEPDVEEMRYTATADGTITVFPDPDAPEGEAATWEVKADGKLHITSKEGSVMVMSRPA